MKLPVNIVPVIFSLIFREHTIRYLTSFSYDNSFDKFLMVEGVKYVDMEININKKI